jgi:hypothetical protein
MEFDRATDNGIPRLCFIVEDTHLWLPHNVDSEPGKSRLNSFKRQKIDKLIRAKFTTPDNLAMKVAVSLIPYISRVTSATEKFAPNGEEQRFEPKSLVVYGLEARIAMNELRQCMERLSGLANTFNIEVDRNSTSTDKSDPDEIKFARILSATPENLIQLALPMRGQILIMRFYWRIFAINSIKVISFIDNNKSEHILAINGFKLSVQRSLVILNTQKSVFRKLYSVFKDIPVTDSDFDYGVSQVTQVFSETINVINDGISVSEEIIREIEKS